MTKTYLRAFIGGPVGSGKSRLALTAGRTMILYGDRMGGESELLGLEEYGIFVRYIDTSKPRESLLQLARQLRDKWIEEFKLDAVFVDSWSYIQKYTRAARSQQNLNSIQLQQHGKVGNDMLDAFNALAALPVDLVVLTHIREKTVENGQKIKIGTEWMPDIQAMAYNEIAREAKLMGYTWKRGATKDSKGNPVPARFGVSFVEETPARAGGTMFFREAKAPPGWGASEPQDVRAWRARLAAEVEATRKATIATIKNVTTHVEAIDADRAEPEPEPTDDNTNTSEELP